MEIYFIFTILMFCSTQLTHGTNILLPGESLKSSQTLVSPNGEFAFGFSAGECDIGIWFTNDHKELGYFMYRYVWAPYTEYSYTSFSPCTLSLYSGDLVVTQSNNLMWSTNLTKTEQVSTILVLLDTGNLVLCDRTNSNKVTWQSFDHPSNTWLPGAWLGFSNINGKNITRSLVSKCWSLQIDNSSGRWGFIVMNQQEPNITYFGTFPSGLPIKYNNGLITINSTKSPLLFVTLNDYSFGINIWRGAELLNGYRECDLNCGPFGICISNITYGNVCKCPFGFQPSEEFAAEDYGAGCLRNVSWNCKKHSVLDSYKYTFHVLHNITRRPPSNEYLKDLSQEQCKSFCLNNCSCTAYSFDGGNCYNWYGELQEMLISDVMLTGMSIYIRLATFNKSKNIKLIIGGILTIVIGCSLFLWIFARKFGDICSLFVDCFFGYLEILCDKSEINDHISVFTYRQMRNATENFSFKLGEGGFGSVFKGRLLDSTEVAVKNNRRRGEEDCRTIPSVFVQEEKQFRTEVQTLGMVRHINLVGLLGFCAEGKRRFLVYEYMPKGSLDSHLFTESITFLSWKSRYRIVLGIARGLAYLHEGCRDCIIHCDIKPENVLLDEYFFPKIADFGMAKLLDRGFSRALTTMRGTIGYLAPEWISGEAITHKADVYSFGMMLFEIISGKRNASKFNNRRYPYFPLYATVKINEGEVLCLLDKRLGGNVNVVQLIQFCKVAGWCIQDSEAKRPSMGKIVLMLQGLIDVGIPPAPKSLLNLVDAEDYFFEE